MSPVVAATECMPRRKANASTGVIVNTNGSIRARLAAPPMPGKEPDDEPGPHAHEHEAEGLPLEDQDEPVDEGVEHLSRRPGQSTRKRAAGRSPPGVAWLKPDAVAAGLSARTRASELARARHDRLSGGD